MTTNFDAALEWRGKGYNVVPQKAVDIKHPGVKWKPIQARLVTPEENGVSGDLCSTTASASSPARLAASL